MIHRKQILTSLILSLFWVLFIHTFGSPQHTFNEKWTDNVSNISSTALFFFEGMNLYQKPTRELVGKDKASREGFSDNIKSTSLYEYHGLDRSIYLVWGDVPRPYPLGAWIWYSLPSFMFYGLKLKLETVTFVSTFMGLILAHICFFMFLNAFFIQSVKQSAWVRAIEYFVLFSCYVEFVRWSGQGQYDVFGLFFLILACLSIRSNDSSKGLLFFGISLNIHFRSLLALGPIIYEGLSIFRQKPFLKWMTNIQKRNLIIFFGLSLVSGVIFLLNLKYVTDSSLFTNNQYHFLKIQSLAFGKIIFLLFGSLIPSVYLILKKNWRVLGYILSVGLILTMSPLVRGWYILYLFPMFLLLSRRSKSYRGELLMVFLSYITLASTYIGQGPFDFTFFQELFSLIKA